MIHFELKETLNGWCVVKFTTSTHRVDHQYFWNEPSNDWFCVLRHGTAFDDKAQAEARMLAFKMGQEE